MYFQHYIYIYEKKTEHYNSIIMESQNIIDLLNNTQNQPFKFKIKNQAEIYKTRTHVELTTIIAKLNFKRRC